MVAASVPRLGFTLKPSLARPMLFAALECFDHGDYIGAGVRLREAIKRFLISACEWHGVPVPKDKHASPARMARALHDAGHMGAGVLGWVSESIDCGNTLAHCGTVRPDTLRTLIGVMFAAMDGEPYVDFTRQPIVTSYSVDANCDCDDDDHGDDWRIGGAA
jgi:hypothetical protein